MHKNDLLKMIADTGYNVGFGAKKHFATYDMVAKLPGLISFISMTIGIYSLCVDIFTGKFLSATLIIWGIVVLYISFHNNEKKSYDDKGKKLTRMFNELKNLYYQVKDEAVNDVTKYETEYQKLVDEYNDISMSKQIMFSDWYAHYKFFGQHEIDWINEQKNFKLFRDKIPLSVIITILAISAVIAINYFELLTFICSFIK